MKKGLRPGTVSLIKLTRLARLLERARAVRPDRSKPVFDALETLGPLRVRIAEEMPSLDTLRGIEGAAQAAYFRAYTTLFAESLGFTGRNRRPPRDPAGPRGTR
jgi:CRISPR-associated protein Cas1